MSLSCQSLEVSRDDSGNSSSSSSNSSVILSLDELTQCQPAPSTSLSSSVDTGLWQPDCSLYYTGYELADSDVLLPLHKTVCCALCRKKQDRLNSMTGESNNGQLVHNGHVDVSRDVNDEISDDEQAVRYRVQAQPSASKSGLHGYQLSDCITRLQLSHEDKKLMAALVATRQQRRQGAWSTDISMTSPTRHISPRKLLRPTDDRGSSSREITETTSQGVDQLRLKQEQEDERLNALRHNRQLQLAQKAQANNAQIRLTLEQARQQERQALEELKLLGDMIDASLSAAELKVKQKRQQELARMRAELQRKIERSRQKQRQLEEELRRRRESLVEYMQQQDRNARSKVEAQLANKRETAAKKREHKQRLQRENLLKMQEKEREWKASVEASIEFKDARSRQIQQEREAARKQARQSALTSKHLVKHDLRSRSMSLQ